MAKVEGREREFLQAIGWDDPTPEPLFDAMADVSRRHAELLGEHGPVRVLAFYPCPNCDGRVIATSEAARCASGCSWRQAA